MTLEDARRVIAAAEKKAKEIGQPMNIAVADEGGNLAHQVGAVVPDMPQQLVILRGERVAAGAEVYDIVAGLAQQRMGLFQKKQLDSFLQLLERQWDWQRRPL